MKEVIVVAIWDKNEDNVFTRSIMVDLKHKGVKMNGRKPNKLIVPESLKDTKLLRKVKALGAYDCQIITATGK